MQGKEVWDRADQMDMIIKAAAVADYRPLKAYDDKVKKSAVPDLERIPM